MNEPISDEALAELADIVEADGEVALFGPGWDALIARLRAAEARAVPPTVDDLEAYIVTAMIQWDADTAGTRALPGYIARSIHPRLVPLSPTDTPEVSP